ncbi:hypothetical protein [Mameliella sp.]
MANEAEFGKDQQVQAFRAADLAVVFLEVGVEIADPAAELSSADGERSGHHVPPFSLGLPRSAGRRQSR